MHLSSVFNEKVKFWEKLKLKKYRDENKLFLIEDEHLIKEALQKEIVKEIITIDEKATYNVPTYYVTKPIMQKISSQVSGAKVIGVCSFLKEDAVTGNILAIDNLQDPGNLGTIIRSAVAFNFSTILLSDDSVDLYNPKVIRASEGMLFYPNIIRCNLKDTLNNLKKDYQVIGTHVSKGKSIRDLKIDKVILVIGNEGKGLSEEVQNLCDTFVNIKMNPQCESLNAGVAASILMYEVQSE